MHTIKKPEAFEDFGTFNKDIVSGNSIQPIPSLIVSPRQQFALLLNRIDSLNRGLSQGIDYSEQHGIY